MPNFSVIIPTFNRAYIVSRAIESVLTQSFSDFELIVVDDGSTDPTQKAVEQYLTDRRVFYFRQENSGVTAARNFGASQATGKFLVFLDSDDWLGDDYLKVSHAALTNEKIKLLLCSINYVPPNGAVNKIIEPKESGDYYAHPLTGSYIISAGLYSQLGGYDENLTYSENSDFFLRLFSGEYISKNEILVLPTIYVCIPLEDTQVRNSRHAGKRYDNATYFLNKHALHFKRSNKDFVNFKKIQAISALQQGRVKESKESLIELLKRNPLSVKSIILFLFISLMPGPAKRHYSGNV